MATSYGDYNPTTPGALTDGAKDDAAIRSFGKKFSLAGDADPAGGTTNLLHIGRMRAGVTPQPEFKIGATVDCSGLSFKIGTLADDDYFSGSVTGPAANATVSGHLLPAVQRTPLAVDTDIYAKPSGALPASGTLVFTMGGSHK